MSGQVHLEELSALVRAQADELARVRAEVIELRDRGGGAAAPPRAPNGDAPVSRGRLLRRTGIVVAGAAVAGGMAAKPARADDGDALVLGRRAAQNDAGSTTEAWHSGNLPHAFLFRNGWDGINWTPHTGVVVGYSQQSGVPGVRGVSTVYHGIVGETGQASHAGVVGTSPNGAGVWGTSSANTGTIGQSTSGLGVYGESRDRSGVLGRSGSAGSGEDNAGVCGSSASRSGVLGVSTSSYGVRGKSSTNSGVYGSTSASAFTSGSPSYAFGVLGISSYTTGVRGESANSYGVHGLGPRSYGVVGEGSRAGVLGMAATTNGVTGNSTSGNGVLGNGGAYGGEFIGGRAPVRLRPHATIVGKPTTGTHKRGELFADAGGALWYCTHDGTPGTWRRVSLV